MQLRTLGSLALPLLLLLGCAGGGTQAPPAKAAVATPTKAFATVHFNWPVKNSTSRGRSAQFISPSATYIQVTNSYSYYYLAPSDATVTVPAGTVSAQIPAFVGSNYWSFTEYDANNAALAYGSQSAYISSPNAPTVIDVVMAVPYYNMGAVVSTDLSTASTTSATITSTASGTIRISSGPASTFHLYLQAADRDGNPITGAGAPGISLTSTSSGVTIARVASPTTGPYAGQVTYQVSAPSISCGSSFTFEAVGINSTSSYYTQNINALSMTTGGC